MLNPNATPKTSLPALIQRTQARGRRRRLVIAGTIAAVALGGLAAWALLRPKPPPLSARFRAALVTSGDILREVRATGRVDAVASVDVGAEISGRIATVEVDYNQRVKTGDVLARFDRSALEAQRAQTAALVLTAKAQLAQARFDLEQAKRNSARADELFAQKAQSAAEHEASATTLALAKTRVEAAEAGVAAQEAAATLARTNIEHAVIRAPISGVIITRNIDPGQTVTSMLQTPVLFKVAADLRKMEVVAAVDEADIAEVAVGQRAFFSVNAYPGRTFEGVVAEVRYAARVVQDVVTYAVVVAVDNVDLALKPSMTASVRVRTGTVTNVARVANAAFNFTPPGQPARTQAGVWVLDGEQLAFAPATPGLSDGELSALGDATLAPGTKVVVDLSPEGRTAYDIARP